MKTIKERLAANELLPTFALGKLLHPLAVEMFALAGKYVAFWIDQEHASHTSERIAQLTVAGRANGLDSFVRIPPTGYAPVTQYLEAGSGGTMAAQIHSADQAREFVSWCKFPPAGTRGLNVSGRDGNYTHKPIGQFVEDANNQQFVAIQIETLGSLEQADEIAAIDGVDLLFVGPSDLSMSLGVVGQFHHEKLWEAISHISQACQNHGKHWGAVVPDPEFAAKAVELNCKMPTVGNGVGALRKGIGALQDSFGAVFG